MNSTDLSSHGKIFSQKLSLTGTRRKCDSGMKSGLGQVLLALRTYAMSFCCIRSYDGKKTVCVRLCLKHSLISFTDQVTCLMWTVFTKFDTK